MKRVSRRLAVVGGIAIIVLFSAWLMIQAHLDHEIGAELVASDSAEFWPLDHAWSFRLKPNLFSKSNAQFFLRTTQEELPPGTSPVFQVNPKHPPKTGRELSTGTFVSLGDDQFKQEGRVSCQVIDLRTIGIPYDEHPLRMVLRFRIGGTSVQISGDTTKLPGDQLTGSTQGNCRWHGDELHLFSFFTRTEHTVFVHHLLLRQSNTEFDSSPQKSL